MTPAQRDLARHALGLDGRRTRTFRNHFVCSEFSEHFPHWSAMVEAGDAFRGKYNTAPGDRWFHLTRHGAEKALDRGESLDQEDFPR